MLSRADLDFLLYTWLDIELLTKRERYAQHSRETFNAVLELSERVAGDHFATHNRLSDAHEPVLDGGAQIIPEVKAALEVFARTGLIGSSMDEASAACSCHISSRPHALPGFRQQTSPLPPIHSSPLANANLLLAHGTPDQIATYVRPMLEGRFFGTMCLSEPQAGSSLADITTRAEPQDDGTYRLFGNKMWISGGDHDLSENIVHLVLAKIPGGPPGVKGICLFIVPEAPRRGRRHDRRAQRRRRRGAQPQDGLPRHRRTPCSTSARGATGRTARPAPSGTWSARRISGLAYMFHMMNEARIGVGIGAAALGYTATSSRSIRARAPAGRRLGAQGSVGAAGADHRARRRAAHAPGAEVLCRRRDGARPVLRPAASTSRRPPRADEAANGRACCSSC